MTEFREGDLVVLSRMRCPRFGLVVETKRQELQGIEFSVKRGQWIYVAWPGEAEPRVYDAGELLKVTG